MAGDNNSGSIKRSGSIASYLARGLGSLSRINSHRTPKAAEGFTPSGVRANIEGLVSLNRARTHGKLITHEVAKHGTAEAMSEMVRGSDHGVGTDHKGNTPMMNAIARKNFGAFQALIKLVGQPNFPNPKTGRTALHEAVEACKEGDDWDPRFVEALAEHKDTRNLPDKRGVLPTHIFANLFSGTTTANFMAGKSASPQGLASPESEVPAGGAVASGHAIASEGETLIDSNVRRVSTAILKIVDRDGPPPKLHKVELQDEPILSEEARAERLLRQHMPRNPRRTAVTAQESAPATQGDALEPILEHPSGSEDEVDLSPEAVMEEVMAQPVPLRVKGRTLSSSMLEHGEHDQDLMWKPLQTPRSSTFPGTIRHVEEEAQAEQVHDSDDSMNREALMAALMEDPSSLVVSHQAGQASSDISDEMPAVEVPQPLSPRSPTEPQ